VTNHTRNDVIKMLATMATIMPGGERVTEDSAKLIMHDLEAFDPNDLVFALNSIRREQSRFPTISEILARVQANDGRPGPEEAWALCPKDDAASAYVNDEIMEAWGVASGLLDVSKYDARKAFGETYARIVQERRASAIKPKWWLTQGYEKNGRAIALRAAIEKGRISVDAAQLLLPEANFKPLPVGQIERSNEVRQLILGVMKGKSIE
jgi:hypothetical protein